MDEACPVNSVTGALIVCSLFDEDESDPKFIGHNVRYLGDNRSFLRM